MSGALTSTLLAHWASLVDDLELARDDVERVTGRPPRTFALPLSREVDDSATSCGRECLRLRRDILKFQTDRVHCSQCSRWSPMGIQAYIGGRAVPPPLAFTQIDPR